MAEEEEEEEDLKDVFHIIYQGAGKKVEMQHTERGPVFLVEFDKNRVVPFKMELDEHSNEMWLEEGIATERAAEIGHLIEVALL